MGSNGDVTTLSMYQWAINRRNQCYELSSKTDGEDIEMRCEPALDSMHRLNSWNHLVVRVTKNVMMLWFIGNVCVCGYISSITKTRHSVQGGSTRPSNLHLTPLT